MLNEENQKKTIEFCRGCVKFNEHGPSCEAFNELYPLWGKGECWAREEDPEVWDQVQREVEIRRDEAEARRELERDQADEIKKRQDRDIKSVYKEDVFHRTRKRGGGEKNDRTHKIFTKERMKDNRYVMPWGEG